MQDKMTKDGARELSRHQGETLMPSSGIKVYMVLKSKMPLNLSLGNQFGR